MKKQTNKQEPVLSISATLSETRLLKKLVERLAGNSKVENQIEEPVQPGWTSFNTSSIEAFVSGHINLSCRADFIRMPFVNSFVFTCINAGKEESRLVWASSLS